MKMTKNENARYKELVSLGNSYVKAQRLILQARKDSESAEAEAPKKKGG